jgi:hypothetical protein
MNHCSTPSNKIINVLEAPRVNKADIEANIRSEFYFTGADGVLGESQLGTKPALHTNMHLLTFCVLVLRNGARVVGINYGPVCEQNFSAEDAKKYAREDAIEQIWPLMGYALREQLFQARIAQGSAIGPQAVDGVAEVPEHIVEVFVEEGSTVKINGIPAQLACRAVVRTNPSNVPLMFEGQQGSSFNNTATR